MFPRHLGAMPLTEITMHGDVPIPVELPAPPAIPSLPTLPPVPIPNVAEHISVAVHGAEYAWEDVRSWVSDRFHSLLNFGSTVAGVTFQDVTNIVDVAESVAQTAWASFVTELTGWISAGLNDVGSLTLDVMLTARRDAVWLYDYINGAIDGTISLTEGAIRGIDATIATQWEDTVAAIDYVGNLIKSWAIDNIYSPLLDDVTSLGDRTLVGLETVLADAKAYADDLVKSETAERIAAIAGIAAAVAAATAWIDDCGEPMCEQLGPKTDLGKLLKALNLAADALLLAQLGALTDQQLVALINEIAAKLGQLIGDVETMFITGGDTLGQLITAEIGKGLFG